MDNFQFCIRTKEGKPRIPTNERTNGLCVCVYYIKDSQESVFITLMCVL